MGLFCCFVEVCVWISCDDEQLELAGEALLPGLEQGIFGMWGSALPNHSFLSQVGLARRH